jgi:hypothetical protein
MRKKNNPENKGGAPKKPRLNPQQRAIRTQRILFMVLGILVVLSMLIALVYKY